MSDLLNIKGIGKTTIEKFNKKDIYSTYDLIYFYPISYNYYNINEVSYDEKFLLTCKISSNISSFTSKKGVNVTSFFIDFDNKNYKVIGFNQQYLKFNYQCGDFINILGTYDENRKTIVLIKIIKVNFENEVLFSQIEPNYSQMKKISNFKINSFINEALLLNKDDENYNYLKQIHNPENEQELTNAIYNLKYNEFEKYINKVSKLNKSKSLNNERYRKNVDDTDFKNFKDKLDFCLTNTQELAVQTIMNNLNSDVLSSQLLLGDVGSGKTVVALACAYCIIKKGYQVAYMAPTSILAKQVYGICIELFKDLNCEILTSELKVSQKNRIKNSLLVGATDILIGTHSIIQDDVEFNNLGFIIIDEQHRFGVKQREKLVDKSKNVETLMLSATPIPRSLALTFYNILDVVKLESKPNDRQPILTKIYNKSSRTDMMEVVETHLENNECVYMVAPHIENNESLNVSNVLEVYEAMYKRYNKQYGVGLVHGYIKDKDDIIEKFKSKEIQLLVCTTVIEVGIDVSDATCIVILNAERFGVATLHQLRGRVGRNHKPSECLLYTNTNNEDSIKRLNYIVENENGFDLSIKDMSTRGAGDLFGIQQSGSPDFKIFDINYDLDIANEVLKKLNINDN